MTSFVVPPGEYVAIKSEKDQSEIGSWKTVENEIGESQKMRGGLCSTIVQVCDFRC